MPHAAEANFERVDMLKSPHVNAGEILPFCYWISHAIAVDASLFLKDNTLLRMMPRKRD